MREINGLAMDPAGSGWYYFALGQVQMNYTGLVLYDGQWFYVQNGKLMDGYTGIVRDDGVDFYIVNGRVL